MDLEYAIKLVRSIGECEVGTIKKMAINMVLKELEEYRNKYNTKKKQ